jgi:uncharacterized membrane protein
MKKSKTIILGVIILSFIIGAYFYPQMPDRMASHWNVQGEVDSYMSKFWGLFLMPIVSIGLLLLFILIPKIDPLKENIEKFRKYFDDFMVLMIVFLFYIYVLTLAWNIGLRFDMGQAIIPAMGLLFYYVGTLLVNTKRNWFIGIKTPWTLSSDKVWEETHRVGGKLFKLAGIITILGLFFLKWLLWFVVVPVILFAFYTFIYSYFVYQKELKLNK